MFPGMGMGSIVGGAGGGVDPMGWLGNIAKAGNPYLAGQDINPLAAILLSTSFQQQGPNGGFNFNGPQLAGGMFMNRMLSEMMGNKAAKPTGSGPTNTEVDSPSSPASTPIIRTPASQAMRFGMGAPQMGGGMPMLPLMGPPAGLAGPMPFMGPPSSLAGPYGRMVDPRSYGLDEPPGY